jgi:hypothetical protein
MPMFVHEQQWVNNSSPSTFEQLSDYEVKNVAWDVWSRHEALKKLERSNESSGGEEPRSFRHTYTISALAWWETYLFLHILARGVVLFCIQIVP